MPTPIWHKIVQQSSIGASSSAAEVGNLLLETGDTLLLESGDVLILE